MKNLNSIKYDCLLLFIILIGTSCSEIKFTFSTVKKTSEVQPLKRLIVKKIDSNSVLSEIPVLVEYVSGSYVKLKIPASSSRPISDKAISALRRGESLQSIQKNERSVNFLIDFEELLQRMFAVKTVSWTADESCSSGFVWQSTALPKD